MKNEKATHDQVMGSIFFTLFFTLIISGIVAKRIYGHPDWMVFFHLPAAVFLVLAGRSLSKPIRDQYRKELSRFRGEARESADDSALS